jgi:predicted nuclease of restriction endonuclease-like (RecB) superfamily
MAPRHYSLEVKRSEAETNFCLQSSAKDEEKEETYISFPTHRSWRDTSLIKQIPRLILQGDLINHNNSKTQSDLLIQNNNFKFEQ